MADTDDPLRAAVRKAVDASTARDVAQRAGVSHETVYALLRGDKVSDRSRRLLSALTSPDAHNLQAAAPAGRHAPSYWEGRMAATADTLDAMRAMLDQARGELRGLLGSGVLHAGAASQPAAPPQEQWQEMEPPDAAATARAAAAIEAARRKEGLPPKGQPKPDGHDTTPPTRQRETPRRVGGTRR